MTDRPVPLPPLPPVPADAGWVPPPGRTLLHLLSDEHYQLRLLCTDLADPTGPAARRRNVADVLTATAVRHLCAEEQYLHPTVRAVLPDGDRLADRELAADRAIERTLRRLAGAPPGAEEFEAAVRAVGRQLGRHAAEATRRTFPLLRVACSEEELVRLGNRVEVAEEAAPTRPHRTSPDRPPWNKIVHPGLGAIDKLRDALTGRRTYLSEL